MNLSKRAKQDLVFCYDENVKEASSFSSLHNFSETEAQVAARRTEISQLGLQLIKDVCCPPATSISPWEGEQHPIILLVFLPGVTPAFLWDGQVTTPDLNLLSKCPCHKPTKKKKPGKPKMKWLVFSSEILEELIPLRQQGIHTKRSNSKCHAWNPWELLTIEVLWSTHLHRKAPRFVTASRRKRPLIRKIRLKKSACHKNKYKYTLYYMSEVCFL